MAKTAQNWAPAAICFVLLQCAFLVQTGSITCAQNLPQISAVAPSIVYPYEDIHIYGSGFGKDPNAISLIVNGRWIPLEINPECSAKRTQSQTQPAAAPQTPASGLVNICVTFHLDTTPNQIDLTNLTKDQLKSVSGEVKLQIRAPDGTVATTQPNMYVRSSEMTWSDVIATSAGVALGLSAFLLLLVGFGTRQVIDTGVKSGLFSTFLLDPQTCSLSLSKFQFYVWTATALFGYVYLLLANLFVQQTGQFPDLPSSLPWIFGTSIGTSISIGAITAARGPKGAGEIRPRMSDLITAGGVVQPDRLQYLVWTLVGASGYVLTILRLDPRALSNLPKVPPTLLALGGVSAAGYVGGRLATKVGPVVDSADIAAAGMPVSAPTTGPNAGTGLSATTPTAPAGPALPSAVQPSLSGIQQAFAASSQSLQSLGPVDSRITSAVQTIQLAISKSGPLIQALSSNGSAAGGAAGLTQVAQESLSMARTAASEISRFAEANLASGNPASPEAIKTAGQTADQVLQQLNLLANLAGQATPAVQPNPAVTVPQAPSSTPKATGAGIDGSVAWVLTLRGRGLSRDATFTFSDPATPALEIDLNIPPLLPMNNSALILQDQLNAGNAIANPEIIEQDTDAGADDMGKLLRVRFRSAAFSNKWPQARRLNFKITNPDGQAAVFPVEKGQS